MENKPQSERAHELAEFVRRFLTDINHWNYNFTDYIHSRYGAGSLEDRYNKFADEIESLAKPDGMPYQLDKDGIPIKLGETVYRADGKKPFEYQIFNNCEYGMTVETISLHRDYIEITCDYYGCPVYFEPEQLIHKNPRTLDDIKDDIHTLISGGIWHDEQLDKYVQEAYDLGLSDGAKKDE